MNTEMILNQAFSNDNLVEQLKIENCPVRKCPWGTTFKISSFQGMEEAIEWYIENTGKGRL